MSKLETIAAREEVKEEKRRLNEQRNLFDASPAKESADKAMEYTVFIRNLPFAASAFDVVEFFQARNFRSIVQCKLQNGRNQSSNGRGTLTVTKEDEYERLLEMDDTLFYRRPLSISKYNRPYQHRMVRDDSVHILHGKSLHIGNTLTGTFYPAWTTSEGVIFEIDLKSRRQLSFEFDDNYRVEFKITDISRCVIHTMIGAANECSLWLEFRRPPICFQSKDEITPIGKMLYELLITDRLGELNSFIDEGIVAHDLASVTKGVQSSLLWELFPNNSILKSWIRTVDPSRSNVFGSCFSYAVHINKAPAVIENLFKSMHLKTGMLSTYQPIDVSTLYPVGAWSGSDDSKFLPLPWVIRYALNVLVVQRKINLLDQDFVGAFLRGVERSTLSPSMLADAILSQRHSPRQQVPIKILKLLDNAKPTKRMNREDKQLSLIRRVFVTPLRVFPEPPEKDQGNRVLRQYKEHIDRFVRVTFVDEYFGSIYSVNKSKYSIGRIMRIIKDGLFIAGDKFEFLAYSNSQLRSHSCWYYKTPQPNEENIPSIDEIRESLGSFKQISEAGKRGARMGQAFSRTSESVEINPSRVKTVRDIIRGPYCFSDGVGYISKSLAEKVALELNLGWTPSAFQIRFGGAKGVVSVMPTPAGYDMVLRDSMVKFQSTHSTLEICSVASAMPCYLNRQVITLLSCLGIDDKSFMDLQKSMIGSALQCIRDPFKAMQLLLMHDPDSPVLAMIRSGASMKDRFVFEWIDALRQKLLIGVQLKSRIYVPNGICLIGALDETGELPEGTIFFQTRSNQYKLPPVGTKVVVGRSPCLHPGDIRVLEVVNHPKLSHLYDVLIFSSNGSIPDPHKMSGGDLDGDIYFVIWDTTLIPKYTYPPMEYNHKPQQNHSNTYNSLEKVNDFFIQFIQNDNLGRIANCHVVFADMSIDGAKSTACLELAELHSIAVDFAKSGVKAEIPLHLQVHRYPDFMEKMKSITYESNKILGKLYRHAIDTHINETTQSSNGYDKRLAIPGHEKYLLDADDNCYYYSEEIWKLACHYEIMDEIQLVSGHFRAISRTICRDKGRRSTEEVLERLKCSIRQIQAKYEMIFWEEFNDDRKHPEAMKKASAWYITAYTYTWSNGDPPYLSFGWLALDPMCAILRQIHG